MKTCCLCKNSKNESDFYLNLKRLDGLSPRCKTCHSECMKKSRTKHKEKIVLANKKYREENKELRKDQLKRYYISHKDKVLSSGKRWASNNKDKVQIKTARYRSKKKNLASTLTEKEWVFAIDYFENKCVYCDKTVKTFHQEHFIPVSSGGEYSRSNILPSCGSCNSSKSNTEAFKWMVDKFGEDVASIKSYKIDEYFKYVVSLIYK